MAAALYERAGIIGYHALFTVAEILGGRQADLLEIAGSQAASYLAQQDAADGLMVARQFESFNRMSTFVVHDLKNLVSTQESYFADSSKYAADARCCCCWSSPR